MPLTKGAVMEVIGRERINSSFLDFGQSTKLINKHIHLYAAPAFLSISRRGWIKLRQPSLHPTNAATFRRVEYVRSTAKLA